MNSKYKTIVKALERKDFIKILDFYLFNCPVKFKNGRVVSSVAKTFEKRKISGNELKVLLRKMKDIGNVKIEFVKQINENNYKNIEKNSIVLIENNEIKKTKTVFYAIRNVLAHAGFEIKKNTFHGKNTKSGKVKAIVNLDFNVLLEWISLVEKSSK